MQFYNTNPTEEEKIQIYKTLKKRFSDSILNIDETFTEKSSLELKFQPRGIYVAKGKIYKSVGTSPPYILEKLGYVIIPEQFDLVFSVNVPAKYIPLVSKVNSLLQGYDNPKTLKQKNPKKIKQYLLVLFFGKGRGLLRTEFRDKLAIVLNVLEMTLPKCGNEFETCFRKYVNLSDFKNLLVSNTQSGCMRAIQKL